MVGLRRLRAILEHQLELAPLPQELVPPPLETHDNVRGAQYYS